MRGDHQSDLSDLSDLSDHHSHRSHSAGLGGNEACRLVSLELEEHPSQ